MAKPLKSPKPPKPAAKSPESYPVGYGKPPKSTQFQPGQSGNPSGASKKVRARTAEGLGSAFDHSLLEEGGRTLVVHENGKRTKIPMARAISRSLMIAAAKGDRSAQKLVLAREIAAYDRLQTAKTDRFGLLVQYVTSQTLASNRTSSYTHDMAQIWPHPSSTRRRAPSFAKSITPRIPSSAKLSSMKLRPAAQLMRTISATSSRIL